MKYLFNLDYYVVISRPQHFLVAATAAPERSNAFSGVASSTETENERNEQECQFEKVVEESEPVRKVSHRERPSEESDPKRAEHMANSYVESKRPPGQP